MARVSCRSRHGLEVLSSSFDPHRLGHGIGTGMSAVAHIIERWRSALHPSTATALKVTRLGPGSALLGGTSHPRR